VPEDATASKIGLAREEGIIFAAVYDAKYDLVLGTARGKVKRTALADMEEHLIDKVWAEAIRLVKGDRVVFAGLCGEKGQVVFCTNERVLRTQAIEISRQQTPSARGVAGIKLAKDDVLVGGAVLADPKRCQVFILSETGYLKRLSLDQFTLQGRGGKGMQALKITKSAGPVVAATAGKVIQATKVDVLAQDGKRQRIPLKSIPRARTRASRGKKLVTLAGANDIVLLN
jgi:DNA gyrase subunit A